MSTCPFNSIFLRTTHRSFCHFLCFKLQKASNQIINNRKLKRNCGSVNRPRPIACVISSLIKVKSSHSKSISYVDFCLWSEFDGRRSSKSSPRNHVRGHKNYRIRICSKREARNLGARLTCSMLVTKKI